jgi:hypothetical protein
LVTYLQVVFVDDNLERAVLQSAQCALEIRQNIHHFTPTEGIVLNLHCAIAAGILYGFNVGSQGRWEFIIGGDPLNQVKKVEDAHRKNMKKKKWLGVVGQGAIGLSSEAWKLVEYACDVTVGSDDIRLLVAIKSAYKIPKAPLEFPQPPLHLEQTLNVYVPQSVLPKLKQSARFIGELRRVSGTTSSLTTEYYSTFHRISWYRTHQQKFCSKSFGMFAAIFWNGTKSPSKIRRKCEAVYYRW